MMSRRRLVLYATIVSAIVALGVAVVAGAGAKKTQDSQELTVMTNAISIFGLTAESLKSKNTIGSWYRHYHALWAKKFPQLKINEIQTTGDDANVTKTLLAVNAGNPADLIAVHSQLPLLVARRAVENLDKYYKAAGITPDDFLKPAADAVRFNGHWYGLPGASNPTTGTLLYVPKLVKAAGIKNKPVTWSALYQASKKAVKFDAKGDLVRIGLQVDTNPVFGGSLIDTYCGQPTLYDAKTNTFHANVQCVKDAFTYQKRLLDLYGGIKKYTKFISGDPSVWSCSDKAYLPTGKTLFVADAYWSGGQMDTCYDVVWELGPIPTHTGSLKEWRGLSPAAWFLTIPRGAKNPQFAFDFVKYTIWEHGDRLGPTTNGYVVPSQADAWAKGLVAYTGGVRKKNGYAGNPMAAAMKWVKLGATLGRAEVPKSQVATYFAQQMSLAWQGVAFGRTSVDDALAKVQKLVDQQMKLQPGKLG